MKQYLDLAKDILKNGFKHPDRTGNGRISVHGRMMRFNLQEGFPLLTTKKVHLRGIMEELFWFLRGSVDNSELTEKKVSIWNEWAVTETDIDKFISKLPIEEYLSPEEEVTDEKLSNVRKQIKEQLSQETLNSIGNLYGRAWRNIPYDPSVKFPIDYDWYKHYSKLLSDKKQAVDDILAIAGTTAEEVDKVTLCNAIGQATNYMTDQIAEVIHTLKTDPHSARIIVSAWNPAWVPFSGVSPQENAILGKGSLAACHAFFQFHVSPPKVEGGKQRLTCQILIRSWDYCLGAPYNIASYAALTMMIAQVVGMEANELIVVSGDTHIYKNHVNIIKEQLTRIPRQLPILKINPEVTDILAFKWEDFTLEGYDPHPKIDYPIAI